jgi:hypothetical protein
MTMVVSGQMARAAAFSCWLAASLMAMAAVAQEEAEDSPFRPGLVATYSAGGQAATRVDEVVAFDWQDAAADERLAAGEFAATWRGRLWARGAGEYRLSCYVQGEVEIKLGGKTLIEGRSEQPGWLESQPVALDFDHHPIEIQYRRNTPQGQLKLFWSGPDFRLEPLPAWALVHEREQSPVVVFERGRQLAAALRCGACHKDKSASMVTAPALDRLSGNVNEAWLVDWLASHGEGKASGSSRRMPDLGMSREDRTEGNEGNEGRFNIEDDCGFEKQEEEGRGEAEAVGGGRGEVAADSRVFGVSSTGSVGIERFVWRRRFDGAVSKTAGGFFYAMVGGSGGD